MHKKIQELKVDEIFRLIVNDYFLRLESAVYPFPYSRKQMGHRMKSQKSRLDHNFKKFEKKYKPKEKVIQGRKVYEFSTTNLEVVHDISKLQHLTRELLILHKATHLLKRNVLIGLISQYDTFLTEVVRLCFEIRPELYDSLERTFTLKDIGMHKKIEDIRRRVLLQELDNFLRQSHDEQLSLLERRFDLKLIERLPNYGQFLEICERRNIYTHNDGKTTRKYLDICKKYSFSIEETEKDTLSIDENYLNKSRGLLFIYGLLIAYLAFRQLVRKNKTYTEDLDHELNDIVVNELMRRGENELSLIVFDFVSDIDKYSSETFKLHVVVNRALIFKITGQHKKVLEVLSEVTWETKSDDYRLAYSVLKDDHKESARLMNRIGKVDHMVEAYREWPLFYKFRKTKLFKNTYKAIFGTDFRPFRPCMDIQV